MAEFNPQTSDTGIPDMSSVSRGTGPNRTFETLFSGLTETASNVVQMKDTQTQLDIYDQADQTFQSVNTEFGVTAPDGVTDGLDQMQTLQNALKQGKISEVNYYGRLATLSKQLRSKYPGYEKVVDSTIQSVTGTRPANAYRDAIFQELRTASESASGEEKFQRSYVKENEGVIASILPDYFENPGKYDFNAVQANVAKFKSKATLIDSDLKQLQLMSTKNQFNDTQAKKSIDQDFSFITQSVLTRSINANDPSFQDRINQFVAKGGGSPEETNQFITTISQAEVELRSTLLARGRKEYASHGIISNTDLNAAVDAAMYPLQEAKKAVLGGDFSLAAKYATINKVIEDKQVNDLFADPDIRIGSGLSKIDRDFGSTWLSQKQDAIFGRIQDQGTQTVGDEVTGRVLNGNTTLLNETVKKGDANLTKASLNSHFNAILNPNVGPAEVHNIVESLFGPKATDWLDRRVVDKADQENLYTKFLDPKVTAAIFSKGSDEDKSTYYQWALTKARSIPAFAAAAGDINSLQSSLALRGSGLSIQFDPKTMRVGVRAPQGADPAEVARVWQPYGRAVDALNKVFAVLGPITEASGRSKEEVAKDLVASLSLELDGVNPAAAGPATSGATTFWKSVYDGLSKPIGELGPSAGKETIQPNGFADAAGRAISGAQSAIDDLSRPIQELPGVAAPDAGDIDFIFQAPAATKLTSETMSVAESPLTGSFSDFSDAKTPVDLASKFTGLNEKRDKDVISSFIKKAAGIDINPATTAWCAAFVNGVLGATGSKGTGKLNARSFLDWGVPVSTPTKGDVVILERGGSSSWQGHVGFLISETPDTVTLLGGNQGNSVSEKTFSKDKVLGYRRPAGMQN